MLQESTCPTPSDSATPLEATSRSRWRYPALLFLFGIVVFWKLIFNSEYSILTYPDSSFQTYPWSQYLSEMLHRGSFPFWDVYSDFGRSFIGETQTGAFYPLNLLMAMLPRNARGLLPVSVIEGFLILHVILASLFMYGLARHFRLSPLGSCVAGLVFAYGGSVGLRASAQVNLFYASVWVPAIFWCYVKALEATETKRQVLFANLAGLALALSLLAGHHQPFIYTSLALVGVAAALVLKSRKTQHAWRCRPSMVCRQTLLIFLFGAGYASLQLFPSLEYSHLAYRWVDSVNPSLVSQRIPYSIAGADNALPPHGLLVMLFPYITWVENSPYLGIAPLLLILMALPLAKRNRVVRLAVGLALLATVLALGQLSPLHGLMYALVPGFDKGREAARIFLLAHFALSLVAGFGCDAFLRPATRRERRVRVRLALGFGGMALAVCLSVFCMYFYQVQALSQNPNYSAPGFACLLLVAAAGIGLARSLGWSKAAPLRAAILLTLLFDFHFVVGAHLKLKGEFDRKLNFEPKQYYQKDSLIQFLQSQPGTFRVDFRDEHYPKNGGQVFKLETVGGYGATSLKQFYHFQAEAYPPGSIVADLMNVRYLVSQNALELPVAFQGEHAKVYENLGFLPRAWLAHQTALKRDLNEIVPLLREPTFDPYSMAYLEESLAGPELPLREPAETGPSSENRGTATYQPISANRFRVEAASGTPKMLVVSQNWYPGWRARVNGQWRKVERVNGALMGVPVDTGRSDVEFLYRPTHFYWAAGATLAALVTLVWSLGFGVWPRRFRTPAK